MWGWIRAVGILSIRSGRNGDAGSRFQPCNLETLTSRAILPANGNLPWSRHSPTTYEHNADAATLSPAQVFQVQLRLIQKETIFVSISEDNAPSVSDRAFNVTMSERRIVIDLSPSHHREVNLSNIRGPQKFGQSVLILLLVVCIVVEEQERLAWAATRLEVRKKGNVYLRTNVTGANLERNVQPWADMYISLPRLAPRLRPSTTCHHIPNRARVRDLETRDKLNNCHLLYICIESMDA